ncbi:MAG TPA: ArsC family transcriptional regulator [Ignavibacteriaceae bacterium]|nr:ArsC family transcriptional regulator [Ignavibacteriaceae bacterium]HRP91544.1 ArsC family transcriptional regulator [Ignavibacteriaceae bacterium]HRQ53283.1 ArsC family transcriptional regulator [Ignavibacteriaceae bacterium]
MKDYKRPKIVDCNVDKVFFILGFIINKKLILIMNIQIIGTKKCKETQKAERYFKERRIPFHFRDLTEKGLAKGELENISRVIPLDDLIDNKSKRFKDRGMQFMVFDIEEELLSDPLLLKTPIVRNERLVTLGYQPDVWKKWLSNR